MIEVDLDQEFSYFDRLPSEVREALRQAAFKFSAVQVYDDYEKCRSRGIPIQAIVAKIKFQSTANWAQLLYDEFGVMPR